MRVIVGVLGYLVAAQAANAGVKEAVAAQAAGDYKTAIAEFTKLVGVKMRSTSLSRASQLIRGAAEKGWMGGGMSDSWRIVGVATLSLLSSVCSVAEPRLTGNYDEPPRLSKQTRPQYPQGPFARGVQGTVTIEFTVDEKGRVRDPVVIKSIPDLDNAALDCVKKWRFVPARKEGRAVATRALAPVTFTITHDKRPN
jgi:protein TonB